MNDDLYPMIFKRKSFHIFRGNQDLTAADLQKIEAMFGRMEPLVPDIQTAIRIVPRSETTCKRGQFCILLYSEKKEHFLQNIGYLGEQLDLWLASQNIGVCWYGMGKTEERSFRGLEFIIMLAIEKADETAFRKDMFKSKRKPPEEIWHGKALPAVSSVVRFAPSACNTQPWIVEAGDSTLDIYRYQKPGKRGMMPKDRVTWYNRIDMGIFLLFTELCLSHEHLSFTRMLYRDDGEDQEMTLTARYRIL